MASHKRGALPLSKRPIPEPVRSRLAAPVAVVLGSPAEVVHVVQECALTDAVCYQMDLFQAERLETELRKAGLSARVVTSPDVWDLPPEFHSVLYLPARGGERELKIDVVEQTFHVLRPGGVFLVWSSYRKDSFFQKQIKKIFGRFSQAYLGHDAVIWATRTDERPRRRHELVFHARIGDMPSCSFVSRPGTFAYGRMDEGARALLEIATIESGDRVLDIGCGCGTNGVLAWQRCGPNGLVVFVDSNVRALALAELNARANGVAHFQTLASRTIEGLADHSFDVALANPPYFANSSIARLFVERARALLTPQGRFTMVTKQANEMAALVEETFGSVEVFLHRNYTVLCA
jgi:16S rRNA (guanine1207-N2)-methyltransferase